MNYRKKIFYTLVLIISMVVVLLCCLYKTKDILASTKTITSDYYYIDDQNHYITKVQPSTPVSGFKYCIKENVTVKGLSDDDIVKTGTIVQVYEKGNIVNTYTAVVNGDTTGDGKIDISDMEAIQKHILGKKQLSGCFKRAANIYDKQKEIDISDMELLQKYVLGKIKITHTCESTVYYIDSRGHCVRSCIICGKILDDKGLYNGWYKTSVGDYYYINGVKQTGYVTIDNERYYFDSNGIMKEKLHTCVPTAGYIDSRGHAVRSCTICGKILCDDGPYSGWYATSVGNYYYINGEKQIGYHDIDDRRYYFNSNGICVSKVGIDVSIHNGDIDWNKVKNSNIDFALIRIGLGDDEYDQDDPTALYNMTECERLGIPYGVYIYSYAMSNEEAYSEVNHALRMISGRNPSLGVFYDMEDADGYKNKNGFNVYEHRAEITQFCKIFTSAMSARGYQAGIYANRDYFNNVIYYDEIKSNVIWYARYTDDVLHGTPDKGFDIWQYRSDCSSVNGISSQYVDMNILFEYEQR